MVREHPADPSDRPLETFEVIKGPAIFSRAVSSISWWSIFAGHVLNASPQKTAREVRED